MAAKYSPVMMDKYSIIQTHKSTVPLNVTSATTHERGEKSRIVKFSTLTRLGALYGPLNSLHSTGLGALYGRVCI